MGVLMCIYQYCPATDLCNYIVGESEPSSTEGQHGKTVCTVQYAKCIAWLCMFHVEMSIRNGVLQMLAIFKHNDGQSRSWYYWVAQNYCV